MPLIGMGAAPIAPTLPPIDQLVSIFIDAIEADYRCFDTAAAYGSKEALGRAMAEALQRRLIKSREDVFITSKLWCTETCSSFPQKISPVSLLILSVLNSNEIKTCDKSTSSSSLIVNQWEGGGRLLPCNIYKQKFTLIRGTWNLVYNLQKMVS